MVRATGVLTGVDPNAMLPALELIVETMAVRLRANVVDEPEELAVNVALCADPTAETLAVNAALVAPAGTVTWAGTTTFALLLERLTAVPVVGAAAVSLTVHESFTNPATEALVHDRELTPVAPNMAAEPPAVKTKRIAKERLKDLDRREILSVIEIGPDWQLS